MKGSDAIGLGMADEFREYSKPQYIFDGQNIIILRKLKYTYVDYLYFVQLQELCRSARVKIRAESNEKKLKIPDSRRVSLFFAALTLLLVDL